MKLQRSHIILTVFWFNWFWNLAILVMISAIMPAIQEALSLSPGATGLLLSVFSLGSMTSNLGSGFFCTLLGRTNVIRLGICISLICMLAISLTTNYLFLLILLILLGFGYGTYWPAALSILSDLFSSKERGRYIGIHEMAAPAGMTFGPVFVSLILNLGLGWAGSIQAWIIPGVIILISQFVFVKEQKKLEPSPEEQRVDNTLLDQESQSSSWIVKFLLLVVAAQFCRNLAWAETTMLPTYWVSDLQVEIGTAAFIFGITRIFSIFGQLGAGYLSDIFGRLKVLIVIQALTGLFLIPTSYLPFGVPLFASFTVFSIFFNCFVPVLFAFVSDSVSQPLERAKIFGIVGACGGISGLIGPVGLGLVAENFSFQVAWIIPIVTGFLSLLFLLLLANQFKILKVRKEKEG